MIMYGVTMFIIEKPSMKIKKVYFNYLQKSILRYRLRLIKNNVTFTELSFTPVADIQTEYYLGAIVKKQVGVTK